MANISSKKSSFIRKTLRLIIVATAMSALGGCGNKPRTTVEKFLKDCAAQNFEDAKQYATQEAGLQIDWASGMSGMEKEMLKNAGNAQNTPAFKFIFVREEINGDHAVVTYRPTENAEEQSVPLQRINGKWLVSSH